MRASNKRNYSKLGKQITSNYQQMKWRWKRNDR